MDLLKRIADWKTTVPGFAAVIASLLLHFNWVTADVAEQLVSGVFQAVGAIAGVILIFWKSKEH